MTDQQKAYVAVAIVCVVWGTTYLANKVGVMAVPGLQFAFIRQMLASLLILSYFFLSGRWVRPDRTYLLRQAQLGFFLITMGVGVGTAALKYLDSGIASLLATLNPMIIVILNLFLHLEKKTSWLGWAGMIVAVSGCVVLLQGNVDFYSSRDGILGLTLFGICMFSWSFGSLYSKRPAKKYPPMMNAGFQMLIGGLLLIPLGLIFENWVWAPLDAPRLWALGYLVIFGSILTYGAFVYALEHLPASVVSINAYVNPLIAIYVGWLVLDERLDWNILISTLLILGGIYMISRDQRLQRIRALNQEH